MMEMNLFVNPRESGSFLDELHVHEIEAAKKNGIMHFGHEHPLMFEEEVKSGFEDEDAMCCNGCGLKIGSCGFSCIMENCRFLLHEFCAYLPKEMKDYPKHPQHPLTLYTHSPSYFGCDVCQRQYYSLFCYHCEVCGFDVDLKCASMSFLVCNNETHEHDLTAQLYPASFMCCYCGEKHEKIGMSYQCRTCSLWIHEQCYSIPRSIKHDSHVHPLTAYDLMGLPGHNSHVHPALDKKYPLKALCGVCKGIINLAFRFYGCFNCKYCIHIKCLTKKWDARIKMSVEQDERNDRLIQFPLASPQLVQNTLVQFMQKICHWKDEESKNDDILNHPAHDHPLTLEFDSSKFIRSIDINDVAKRGVYDVCNACMLPLLDAPLYSCKQSCKFVLHKWCAKLPRELEHPAHTETGHTLILQEKLDECFGFFRCNGCNEIGNGFSYKCNECEEYYLDVRCAALPRLVNYETHDHPLLLKHRRSGGGCISCGETNFHECNSLICNYSFGTISRRSSPFLFGCEGCNFYIDTKCLVLPREVQHWYDEHGFKLTYSTHISSQIQFEENYHCEFCERNLKLDKWIYHCSDCDQSIDTKCVLKMSGVLPRFIKFGGSYDSPQHIHSLTCIAISDIKLCDGCNQYWFFFGIGFQCLECQIVFCFPCVFPSV